MHLKHGGVFGRIVFSLFLVSSVEAQAQGVPSRLSELQARVDRALASLGQLETAMGRIAQLEAALAAEHAAREAADAALQNAIGATSGGVNQAALDAAIAAEANARAAADTAEAASRSTADGALEGQIANEAAARAELAAAVAPLATLTPLAPLATYVSVEAGTINGLAGPHVIVTGANLHIRNGAPSSDSLSANGRGNLIVGYNEPPLVPADERGGSHNVVVGASHRYNFGTGFVTGYASRLGGMAASVSGGGFNEAWAFGAVSGGSANIASGMYSSVLGGDSNIASGSNAVVAAGQLNDATGVAAAVSGGYNNEASGFAATVSGGTNESNSNMFTVVP